MGEFTKAVEASMVKPGSMMTIELGGREVLIANVEGTFHAMDALCTHEQWDLSEGTLDGASVTCAGHGSVWDLRTGKGVFDEPLEDEGVYDVKVEDGFVFIRGR